MKSYKQITLLFFLIFINIPLYAQITEADIDKARDDDKISTGEYYFNAKQYRLALIAWQSLLKDYPDNPRINYMAGRSLLNIHWRKSEALACLKKIEKNIVPSPKMNDKNTDEIPVDGHLYIGQAHHHNGQLDEAIAQYNLYLKKGGIQLSEKEIKEANRWIQWAQNAKVLLANPDPEVFLRNIGDSINTESDEYSPVLSLDENIMYFTSRRLRTDNSNKTFINNETGSYFEDVYVSYKNSEGIWSKPDLVEFKGHLANENEASVSVSADGTIVYVYMDREGGGDIFMSEFVEPGMYSRLENLKQEICSPSWETHCSVTPDGNVLFFTSDRPGGQGGLDIYRVIKLPNGEWSKAEALPPPINTPFDEDAPFIHPSGKILYYSSKGEKSMGEYDVFYAHILEQQPLKFSEPINMGAPINTLDNDMFMITNASGEKGYYSSSQKGGKGGQDIVLIEFKKPKVEAVAILKGFIMMQDGSPIPENMSITINTGMEELAFKPRKIDGGFVMALKPCSEYTIEYFKGETESLKKEKFTVPCNSGYHEIYKELYIDTLFLAVNVKTKETNPDIHRDEKTEDLVLKEEKKNEKTEEKISMSPVSFEQYFGYNKNSTEANNEYNQFLNTIIAQVKNTGTVNVSIEASASRVPTSSFPSNDELAKVRAQNFKKQLLKDLKKSGIKETSVKFININSSVNGPAYTDDFDSRSEAYGKFQFVKARAE